MNSEVREDGLGSETPTPTQRLASVLLGQDVQTFIAERRETRRAWRFIARDLYEATDGQIDVTHETLRQWYAETERAAS
ncbi:hypothetical protein MF406_14395 [Georgenia sp. TF02-10]|uniref:hypothetical protein n=1 Tax=Georgenia sp. TF02-10 TaxID=2917725 RepID=UPI001FA735ED|nr:hypothetical protein [Georgenia sp. TF02-10]UNX54122.1 hypothetical protein MF406_14395 [Georgenia sp. TF02-10]